MNWYRWQGDALLLNLRVQPRARGSGVDGVHGERLRIRVAAPAVDDKANAAVSALLAHAFGVPRAAVCLVRGATSRDKTYCIQAPPTQPAWFTALVRTAAAEDGERGD